MVSVDADWFSGEESGRAEWLARSKAIKKKEFGRKEEGDAKKGENREREMVKP